MTNLRDEIISLIDGCDIGSECPDSNNCSKCDVVLGKADAILKACREDFTKLCEEYRKRHYIVTIPDEMLQQIFGGGK